MSGNARPMPQGAICDLITPFRGDQLDEAAFADLAEWQINSGISGLLVAGPTGEPCGSNR